METVEFSQDESPMIQVRALGGEETHTIEIIDNGKGLPEQHRQRLLEPYMTTREKGTGLGLAIVGKILEEHGGTIELLDAPQVAEGGRGAMVRVILPISAAQQAGPDVAELDGGEHSDAKKKAKTPGGKQSNKPKAKDKKRG